MLNKIKAGLANVALKFISAEEKITYMVLETFPRNVRPIVILPAVNTVMRYVVGKLENKSFHGLVANGRLNGIDVSVIQTNMGSPGTAMIMEALKLCHCKAAIRIDFCGGLKYTMNGDRSIETGLTLGNVLVPKTIYVTDGCGVQYLQENRMRLSDSGLLHAHAMHPSETWKYPTFEGKYWAADSPDALYAIFRYNLEQKDHRERHDLVWSSDSLFCESTDALNVWRMHECNAVDMESSIIYLLGALFNIPAVSLLGVSDMVDVPEFNLMKLNKIHPGLLQSLDDAYQLLLKGLPLVQKLINKYEN